MPATVIAASPRWTRDVIDLWIAGLITWAVLVANLETDAEACPW